VKRAADTKTKFVTVYPGAVMHFVETTSSADYLFSPVSIYFVSLPHNMCLKNFEETIYSEQVNGDSKWKKQK